MFDDHFEVFLADTNESKEINYSIRYQVYCEEMGFENKDDFPLEQEFDEYDKHSVHFIVRHKKTEQWIGAMRLIFKNDQKLPIEQHCLLNEKLSTKERQKTVELSRLCVLKEIRRRVSDTNPPYGITDEQREINETDNVKLFKNHHRINRSIIWGILNAASEYCYSNHITNWYFMTTSSLAKILNKGGFKMSHVGESCYHRGERFPFKKDVFETYKNEIWRNEYVNGLGFRNYSELNTSSKLSEMAA
jgi:N-acyl amino acid synthase of PEP-CTERM/exosortase system